MNLLSLFGLQKATLPVALRPAEPTAAAAVSPMARSSWEQFAFRPSPWTRIPLNQNLRLYEELAEAIPIIQAALVRLTQLVGCPRVECKNDATATDIHDWMAGLHVNRVAAGLDNWFSGWCIGHLLYGRAHAEILPLRDFSDIWGLQTLHTRTIELAPAPDGYGVQLVQRQGFGRTVILNPQLMLSAYHSLRNDDPNGNSLLYGLPLVAKAYQTMVAALAETWERNGVPLFHINVGAPEGFSDPTGDRGAAIAASHAGLLDQALTARAERATKDFATFGDVEIKMVGADGQTLSFQEDAQYLLEDITAVTGLPSWMLARHWSTTERMSSVEAAMLGEVIDEIRAHLEPPLTYLIDLRQRMVGRSRKFKLCWDAPSLIDRKAEAEAERTEHEAATKQYEFLLKLWRLGMLTNLEFVRRVRPEFEDLSDAEIQSKLPTLATEPPEEMPVGGGGNGNGREQPSELPRPGPFGRSADGNGRHALIE